MISFELAQQLRSAGLPWRPTERDVFVLPNSELEGQLFTVNSLPALVQSYHGQPVVTFHASVEWALDYVLLTETLWLPNETQLREALEARLAPGDQLRLERHDGHYHCVIELDRQPGTFTAPDAETAYALALHALLTGLPLPDAS